MDEMREIGLRIEGLREACDVTQEEMAADAMKGLKSAAGYLRRELGSALNLRYTPQIMWALDDSITYGTKLLALINSLGVEQDETEE